MRAHFATHELDVLIERSSIGTGQSHNLAGTVLQKEAQDEVAGSAKTGFAFAGITANAPKILSDREQGTSIDSRDADAEVVVVVD